jgi:hypothetical protein
MAKRSAKKRKPRIKRTEGDDSLPRFDKSEIDAKRRDLYEKLKNEALGAGGRDSQEWLWIISEEVTADQLRSACLTEYIRELPWFKALVQGLQKKIKESRVKGDRLELLANESSLWDWLFVKTPNGIEEKKKLAQLALKLARAIYPFPLYRLLSLPVQQGAFGEDGNLSSELTLPKPKLTAKPREPQECWIGRAVKCSDWMLEIKALDPSDERYCNPPKSVWEKSPRDGTLVALLVPRKFLSLKHLYGKIANWLLSPDEPQGEMMFLDVEFSKGSPLVHIPEGNLNRIKVPVTEDEELVFFAAKRPGLILDGLMATIQQKEVQRLDEVSQLIKWGRSDLIRALRIISSWRVSEGRTFEQWEALWGLMQAAEVDYISVASKTKPISERWKKKRISIVGGGESISVLVPSSRTLTVEKHVKKEFHKIIAMIFPSLKGEQIKPKNGWRNHVWMPSK